jgi:glycerol-3-phosphate O-acyltransferase
MSEGAGSAVAVGHGEGANPAGPRNGTQLPNVLAGEEIASEVVRRVTGRAFAQADAVRLEEIVHETIYAEQVRLSRDPHAPLAELDRHFVASLRRELAHASEARRRELVIEIVDRYTHEITGHFDRRVYSVATRALPGALGALFHGLAPSTLIRHRHPFEVDDRVLLEGELDPLRSLVRHGTVVLVPSHVSNLDSVLVGHAVHRLGLPPVAYGAGLNLFSNAVMGFFMRNLGAYTVDRKKTDPLYRATLKEYATVLLERGQHNLFFPGGTRSRSGAIETHLKKGLLGTAVVAFRHALLAGRPSPRMFIVPCTLTYPLVLEAASLVDDYLREEGGAHYVNVGDEFERPRRWVDFVGGLLELDLRIHLRVGRALDPMGNEVDDAGRSRDLRGRELDPARYLMVGGRVVADDARDAEYTRTLAERVVATYRRDTVALPTSVVAYAVFDRLRTQAQQPDLFRFLRGLGPEARLGMDLLRTDLGRLLRELGERQARGELRLETGLADADPEEVVRQALATFGRYHVKPVLERVGDHVVVGDPNLLFYYRNRLDGHALMGAPSMLTQSRSLVARPS